MIRFQAVLAVAAFCLWLYCLIDIVRSDPGDARLLGKRMWVVVVLLFPVLGCVAWLVLGRPRPDRASPHERAVPQFPEYDRPGRAASTSAGGDDEFLRQVRERAEEQRRRHREERLRWEREQRGESSGT